MKAKLTCIILCVVLGWFAPAGAGQHPAVEKAVHQAREVGVSENSINRMLTAGYRYSVAPGDMAQYVAVTQTAAKEGLPYTHLVDKLQEGLSKRIPAERINRVLNQQLMQLRVANRLANQFYNGEEHASEEAVGRVADLMMTGLSEKEIQSVMKLPAADGLKQHLEAATFFTMLKQAGLENGTSMRIVSQGLQNNFFNSFPVELAFTVKAAHAQKIKGDRIGGETLRVVTRQQTALQMQKNLGLGPIRQPANISDKPSRGRRGPGRFGHGAGPGGPGGGSGSGSSSGHSGGGSGGGSSGHGGGRGGSSGGGHGGGHGGGGR